MWRWADEQGEQRLVSAEELRTAIAEGVLSPSTLVWREGMGAWVEAISVEEFADALPNLTGTGTAVQLLPTKPGAEPTKSPAVGPAKPTLQGLHAREVYAAVKSDEKNEPKEKRTPSVAPPRPKFTGPKGPLIKTLVPNFGPAIPAAPRLPSDAPVKPALAPRPVGTIRPPATTPPPPPVQAPIPAQTPAPAPAHAPPARAPSTSAIDKDWSITDDETTNVPGKIAVAAPRPAPPVEADPRDELSPRGASPQAQPGHASVVRSSPVPSPHAERRPTEESTESSTFQFAKNTLSIRAGKLPLTANQGENAETGANPSAATNQGLPNGGAPPGLMESYAKQPVATRNGAADDAPLTASSADLGLSDDLIPAYAGSTTRIPLLSAPLPAPPKMRETTATAMLPFDFEEGHAAEEAHGDGGKLAHEVSHTVRLDLSLLAKAQQNPNRAFNAALTEPADGSGRNAPMQFKPPPLPPSSAQQVTTGPALHAVKAPEAQPSPQLPLNALFLSGGMLITMVIGAFFLGRCSVKPGANTAPTVRTGVANAARVFQDKLPAPPKPCWVAKQPSRWAPVVSRNIPFELLTLASGKVAIAYAKSEDEAVGIEVSPATGQVDEDYVDKAGSEIARVTPTGKGFFISTVEPSGSLKSMIPVNAEKPFYLGIADKHVAWSDQPSGVAARIWAINDEDAAAGGIRVLSFGNRGILTALRTGSSRQRKVFAGLLGQDRKPVTNLVHVVGSGGLSGEPMIGSNGREVAVVFGDQAAEQGPWKLRIGHAPIGKIPATTTMFETPPGGPGGEANYPAITGLPDGRWVMVWTEGLPGSKVVRAQTFAANFTPVGDPIVLSPPYGNYGSSVIGVVGNYVTIVFAQKGRSNNELWGSVLQCG